MNTKTRVRMDFDHCREWSDDELELQYRDYCEMGASALWNLARTNGPASEFQSIATKWGLLADEVDRRSELRNAEEGGE